MEWNDSNRKQEYIPQLNITHFIEQRQPWFLRPTHCIVLDYGHWDS